MNTNGQTDTTAPERAAAVPKYEAPHLLRLGTLADLTRGGDTSHEPDGYGDAGSSGVI
jgi:hypothetical protein